MDIDAIRRHCLRKRGRVTEEFPFGGDVLVFKVNGKMFLLVPLTIPPLRVNLKCEPSRALELRERYAAVEPGYHMNKKHWNTVTLDGSIPEKEVFAMIDHSYNLVATTLRRGTKTKSRELVSRHSAINGRFP